MGRHPLIRELYACLYAREFPAQAVLRECTDLEGTPYAVMEGEPPLQKVCSVNTKARLAGIRLGMTRVELGTFPECRTLERSKQKECDLKATLFDIAGTFSPRIEDRSSDIALLLGLDIAGMEKLFGREEQLARKLLEKTRACRISARVVISENFDAAACTAKAAHTAKLTTLIPHGGEAAALASLPIGVLDLTPQQAETFSAWGIHSLGALAQLPESNLISRMGQDARRLLRLARGEHPHLFQPIHSPFLLEEKEELETPIELLDSLLFVVGVMLEKLIMQARERVLALSAVTITLALDGGSTHARTVKPALPSLDKHFLLKLLHLDLEVHPPQKAIVGVALKAEAGAQCRLQGGLFFPPQPEPSRLDVTLAHIRKIVGEENVGSPMLLDSHAPDACRMAPFAPASAKGSHCATATALSAMRMLRPPEVVSVRVQDGRPVALFFRNERYTVGQAYGPWTSDGGWWSKEAWGFEQWDLVAQSQDGELLYGCLAHEPAHQQWRMVALYD